MKLGDILHTAHENKASDIHLISGHPPMMRVNTVMTPMDYPILTPASVKATLSVLYGDPQWARTCPPLLPRSAKQTEALAAELRAAGLPLPEPAVA